MFALDTWMRHRLDVDCSLCSSDLSNAIFFDMFSRLRDAVESNTQGLAANSSLLSTNNNGSKLQQQMLRDGDRRHAKISQEIIIHTTIIDMKLKCNCDWIYCSLGFKL